MQWPSDWQIFQALWSVWSAQHLHTPLYPLLTLGGVCNLMILDFLLLLTLQKRQKKWQKNYFSKSPLISLFFYLPQFLTDSFLPDTPFPSVSCPLLSLLINPSITLPVSSLVPPMLRLWRGGGDSGEEKGILREVCVCVCVYPPVVNAMGNSAGLFPKVKISILKEKRHNSYLQFLWALRSPLGGKQFWFPSSVSLRDSGKAVSVQCWGWMPFNRVWGQLWHN